MKQIIFLFILVLGFGLSAFAQNQVSSCPKIEVISGGAVRSGEPISFSANVADTTKNLILEYQWTVSNGSISSGLQTSSITVDTTGLDDVNITATVEIKGLPGNCLNIASETGSVYIIKDLRNFDQFGKLSGDEIKARIQNLYVELSNIPDAKCHIINYGTDKEIAVREKQILKAISNFKYEASRVTLVRGGANPNGKDIWTKIWIVPSNTEFPIY